MSLGLCKLNDGGEISKQSIQLNFEDLHKPLSSLQAKLEATNCLYCYDAPCITACPTGIDIPTFIHQIRSDNVLGSAKTILSENIMGGTCSRACPTEILCEQACVLNVSQDKAVKIGELQRFAVDTLLDVRPAHPFKSAPPSGKKIAIIGAGPAGLSCAHRLAMLGHQSNVFESKSKPGGLNEYGLAAYKMVDDFAQKEVEFLLEIGGINIEYERSLGRNLTLDELIEGYDAVFIGVGLYQSNKLNIDGDDSDLVQNANDFISELRQMSDKSLMHVGDDVVVIGAGNTAIDAAIQSKRLGAKRVTMVYRRGENQASATGWEMDLARQNDVDIVFFASPKSIDCKSTESSIKFERTVIEDGKLKVTGESFKLKTDRVLTAIGQKLNTSLVADMCIENGKIKVDENYQTSSKSIFAGGDCINSGEDLTVQAVEDGKQAAKAIDLFLSTDEQEA